MAPTYIASIVLLLAQLLPLIGIEIESEALTTTITTVVSIVAGLVVAYRQLTTGRATLLGLKP